MKYGEHSQFVEEVIDFVFSGNVLSAVGAAEETEQAWITNDLRLALEANGGEGEIGHFPIAPHIDVSDWGNADLLGHNLVSGENLTIEEVSDGLLWTWQDLLENLAGEIRTSEYRQDPDLKSIDDLVWKRFHASSLERELRERFKDILPSVEPLPGWQHCGEQVANNITGDLRYCAQNRAFNGLTDNFWERMFQLYKQGTWPCGWRGKYPLPGKYIAYRRV